MFFAFSSYFVIFFLKSTFFLSGVFFEHCYAPFVLFYKAVMIMGVRFSAFSHADSKTFFIGSPPLPFSLMIWLLFESVGQKTRKDPWGVIRTKWNKVKVKTILFKFSPRPKNPSADTWCTSEEFSPRKRLIETLLKSYRKILLDRDKLLFHGLFYEEHFLHTFYANMFISLVHVQRRKYFSLSHWM